MPAPVEDEDFVPSSVKRQKPSAREDSETDRTARSLSWLKTQPHTHARKVHTGVMGEGGHPDIDGCQEGRAFKIEMKKPGKRPDPRQMARLKIWQAAGALVGWAEDVHHVKEILAHRADYEWRNPLTGPGDPTGKERCA